MATYGGGVLSSVAFPDGRREDFEYHPDGKLASITEVGVDGSSTHEWLYTWTGDDLTRIDRPDGTAVEYFYDDPAHPGYLTRIELVGTDGTSRRIERAWSYDAEGRVAEAWSGDASPTGPNAVDRWQYSYDSETQTTVTDPLGQQIVYTYDRDPVSAKVRVQQIEGDCPACGLGPRQKEPEPSSCRGCDVSVAEQQQLPIYSVHPSGVWKYDPRTDEVTQEEGRNWFKAPKKRCKKPCEGLQ